MISAALVLSGGGSLGVAHVGVLRKLEKKYKFTHYYGVSAGAIVAAAHACGKTADEISEILHSTNLLSLAFDFSKSNFGIIEGEKIIQFLEKIFEQKTFEDIEQTGKYLRIGATDAMSGERVILSKGSIVQALRASISVPLLFPPFQYQGKWLIDGGLSGNLPLMEAIKEHHHHSHIIAVDVATSLKSIDFSENTFFGKPQSLRKTLERTFRILFKSQQLLYPKDERVLYIRPDLSAFTTLDVNKWKEIEKAGEMSV